MNERMKEIEKRLAEIREEVDKPEADLDALQEESRKLADEYDELKKKAETAEKRQAILDAAMREGRVTRRFGNGKEEEHSRHRKRCRRRISPLHACTAVPAELKTPQATP